MTTSGDLIRRTFDVVAEAVLALREAEDKMEKARKTIQGAAHLLIDERTEGGTNINADAGPVWRALQEAIELLD